MSRKISLYISIFLLLSLITPALFTAKADTTVTIASNAAGTGAVYTLGAIHPSSNATYSGYCQTFNATTTAYITLLEIFIYRHASTATGVISCAIYGISGTYGTNAIPNATLYATSSNTLAIETLTPSVSTAEYFYFDGTVQLVANQKYALAFVIDSASSDLADGTGVHITAYTSSAYGGNGGAFYNTAWSSGGTTDLQFRVLGLNDPLESTPGPLPTGGLDVDTTDADVVMSALIDYGVPVVVMLLPVLFLWLIGGRGKWPFLMGIAIGTGMGYLFGLVPVWLVFIVSIVEVGMAYQSVRSG